MCQGGAAVKTCQVRTDEITDRISECFDYEFTGQSLYEPHKKPHLPKHFGIGVIYGSSGSGKSSLLQSFGEEEQIHWDCNKAIASHFESADDAIERLSATGLNSIPSWMKPYHVLSNGEAFRADLARRLKSGAVIDEFTSVVNRQVAKSASVAIRRYVDSHSLQNVVIATCHSDILDWIEPDWTFNCDTGDMSVGRCHRRPKINLEILPCSVLLWSRFSKHHYLSAEINRGARCWVAVWDGEAVGFASSIAQPSGTMQNAWRGHRTVVLPDYQGLGIGVLLSDAVAEMHVCNGLRYFSKTAHARMGEHREMSPSWRPTSKNKRARSDYAKIQEGAKEFGYAHKHKDRVCYSHEYIGNNPITTQKEPTP
jgi:GNAT superfamily N-acetyltransferase